MTVLNFQTCTRREYKQRCKMTGHFETATYINITENGIKKLLLSLNQHKYKQV